MIRPAGPRRRRQLAGLAGTATLYLAPTAANPQQVAVVGLPTPYGNPTFYLSAAVAQQQIAALNQQAATNAAAGVGLFQDPIGALKTMPDEQLCPLMSHGCVTQAQIADQGRIFGCVQWLQIHPEGRGSGIPDALCAGYQPYSMSSTPTPQTQLTITSQYYPGFGPVSSAPAPAAPPAIAPPATTPPAIAPPATTPPATTTPPASTTPGYNPPAPTTPTTTAPTSTPTTPTTPDPTTTTPTTTAPTTTTTTGGDDILGDPNGSFVDQVIAKLPESLQPTARQLFDIAGQVPAWGWGALLLVIFLLWKDRRKARR